MSYDNFLEWRSRAVAGRPDLSVVVPAFNERRRIVPTIGAMSAHMCATTRAWELIIVDDGSTDGTGGCIESLMLANCRVIRHPRNEGKGSAVRRGIKAASAPLILVTDADYSTPFAQLDAFLAAAANGADIVVGSRAEGDSTSQARTPLRRAMNDVSRRIVRTTLRLDVDDAMCGFKLFTRSAARALCARMTIDAFAFDVEMLFLARRLGMRVDEIPIDWVAAPGSTVRPGRDGLRFLADVAAIRMHALAGKYRCG